MCAFYQARQTVEQAGLGDDEVLGVGCAVTPTGAAWVGSVCVGSVGERPGQCCAALQVAGQPGIGTRLPEGGPGEARRSWASAGPSEGFLQAACMRWGLSHASEAGPPLQPPLSFLRALFLVGSAGLLSLLGGLCRPCWWVCGRRVAARRALRARKKPAAGRCPRPPPEEEGVILISPLGCDGCGAYPHPALCPQPRVSAL